MTTWNYTWRNLEIVCNTGNLSSIKQMSLQFGWSLTGSSTLYMLVHLESTIRTGYRRINKPEAYNKQAVLH